MQRLIKKERQRKNRNKKNGIHDKLKAHRELFSDDGFMNEGNISEPISNPSFFFIHSLLEGFSIVMFSRDHCTISESGNIHRLQGYRLILGANMFVLWREGILHSGAKLRTLAEADDIGQGTTLSPNATSSANGRPTGETILVLHRANLRLFVNYWKETSPPFVLPL